MQYNKFPTEQNLKIYTVYLQIFPYSPMSLALLSYDRESMTKTREFRNLDQFRPPDY